MNYQKQLVVILTVLHKLKTLTPNHSWRFNYKLYTRIMFETHTHDV